MLNKCGYSIAAEGIRYFGCPVRAIPELISHRTKFTASIFTSTLLYTLQALERLVLCKTLKEVLLDKLSRLKRWR